MRRFSEQQNGDRSEDFFSAALKRILDNRTEPWSKYDAEELFESRLQQRQKLEASARFHCHRCGYRG